MKHFIKGFYLLITILILAGCSHTRDVTEIKMRVVKPEVIEDTLTSKFQDTIFTAVEIIKNDTIKYIEFRPDPALLVKVRELQKENKLLGTELKDMGEFYIKVKPDSIIILDTIQTFQTIEKKIETPFLAKAGLILIGIIIGLAGLFYIRR